MNGKLNRIRISNVRGCKAAILILAGRTGFAWRGELAVTQSSHGCHAIEIV
jgi:hypothetical protein